MFFASIKCGHIPAARHPSQKTLKIKHHRPGFGDGMNMLQSDKNKTCYTAKWINKGHVPTPGCNNLGSLLPHPRVISTSCASRSRMCKRVISSKMAMKPEPRHQGPLQVNRAMNMVIHVVKPAINMPFGVILGIV